MTTSPWTRRAEAGTLPAASLDSRRETIADQPRVYTVADLQRSHGLSQDVSRDDDPADSARDALRALGIVR